MRIFNGIFLAIVSALFICIGCYVGYRAFEESSSLNWETVAIVIFTQICVMSACIVMAKIYDRENDRKSQAKDCEINELKDQLKQLQAKQSPAEQIAQLEKAKKELDNAKLDHTKQIQFVKYAKAMLDNIAKRGNTGIDGDMIIELSNIYKQLENLIK